MNLPEPLHAQRPSPVHLEDQGGGSDFEGEGGEAREPLDGLAEGESRSEPA